MPSKKIKKTIVARFYAPCENNHGYFICSKSQGPRIQARQVNRASEAKKGSKRCRYFWAAKLELDAGVKSCVFQNVMVLSNARVYGTERGFSFRNAVDAHPIRTPFRVLPVEIGNSGGTKMNTNGEGRKLNTNDEWRIAMYHNRKASRASTCELCYCVTFERNQGHTKLFLHIGLSTGEADTKYARRKNGLYLFTRGGCVSIVWK